MNTPIADFVRGYEKKNIARLHMPGHKGKGFLGCERFDITEVSGADFTEPFTAGIFVSIAAWASFQRADDETPYWRTLKANGELNEKYPGGIEAQKEKLEAEGHTIIQKGRKNIKYYVKDFEKAIFEISK